MARCDEGYICDVCGGEVEGITESNLYLRYVLGEVPLERLHLEPERHVRCDPATAQYIVHPEFEPVVCTGLFCKDGLDADFVGSEETRVTAGWLWLRGLPSSGLSLPEYPLARR